MQTICYEPPTTILVADSDDDNRSLDLVAAMENCSARDAALKLADWFEVGETTGSKTRGPDRRTISMIESIKKLIDEIEEHNSQIASHASMVGQKSMAIKELATTLAKR